MTTGPTGNMVGRERLPLATCRTDGCHVKLSERNPISPSKSQLSTPIDLKSIKNPMKRGIVHQMTHAKKYPVIRWHFVWNEYVVVGVPDGLTSEFVYEFKSSGNDYLANLRKPVAFSQADLYGYFSQRPMKRVQIGLVEEDRIATFHQKVDIENAKNTLSEFSAAVSEGVSDPPQPPWKCRRCEFREKCSIRHE